MLRTGSGRSVFGHLQLHYAAMETKATVDGGAPKTAPPKNAYPPAPVPLPPVVGALLYPLRSSLLNW